MAIRHKFLAFSFYLPLSLVHHFGINFLFTHLIFIIMKNLAELVKKAATEVKSGASIAVVNAGQKNEKWVITLDRIDKESESGKSLTIGECGQWKFGKPFMVKYNGTDLEVKVKATIYVSIGE